MIQKLRQRAYAALRLARNVAFDLRYGGFLGGSVDNRYPGAKTVGNTDYELMNQIFPGRVLRDDVLVDVGCGKGRVLNFWLQRFPKQRIVGLEIMEEIAAQTARRLRRFPNVRVIAGDAIANLPEDGTLFYLFNPFDTPNMERFKARFVDLCARGPERRILYFAPLYLDVFTKDPAFRVTVHAIEPPRAGVFEERHRKLAEIHWVGPRAPVS